MSIKNLLEKEITEKLTELNATNMESKEYGEKVDVLVKLMEKDIELTKLEQDKRDKADEVVFKREQMIEERKDRRVKNYLTGTSIVLPFGVAIWGALRSWKFEETGTISNGPGREFMKKILHLK